MIYFLHFFCIFLKYTFKSTNYFPCGFVYTLDEFSGVEITNRNPSCDKRKPQHKHECMANIDT